MPADTFRVLTALQYLSINSNKLSTFPAAVTGLTKLTTLSLSSNQITQVPSGSFVNMTSLATL